MRRSSVLFLSIFLFVACGSPAVRDDGPDLAVISIVGTNDLHGHLRALPILAGHLANLRRARSEDGAVLLLDGGDMFQGTLESNLEEGASVVRAYEALGYDAVTIGNHEFDYGPEGPRSTAADADDDPRGALHARIREADFPFLSANLVARDTGAHADLGVPSVLLERAGVRIGVIGVTTESTPFTTIAANVSDLAVRPLAEAIAEEAGALRARGAALIVVTAHAGGACESFHDAEDLESCDHDQEIMAVAAALPAGAVDAIVAGHTHQAMAHRVNGIAIVESYSYGVAFGRVDITVDRRTGRIAEARIHPPHRLCTAEGASPEGTLEACAPAAYEGAAVTTDPAIVAAIAPAVERAASLRDRSLGPTLSGVFAAERGDECALGNLFTDLMLRARPSHDVALVNGGGLRAPLPAGPLRYGALYESFPFDNRFATVRITGDELEALIVAFLGRDGSFFSIGGLRAETRCESGALRVALFRPDGRRVLGDEVLAMLTSDFLATGGDGAFAAIRERPGAVTLENDPPIREAIAEELGELGEGALDPSTYYGPAARRFAFPGERPVLCAE